MTIVLIDQHPVLQKGMALFISSSFEGSKIIQSYSLSSYHELYKNENPALIIIGEGEHGAAIDFNMVRILKRKNPGCEMIIYSGKLQYHVAVAGLTSGVKGYMLKNSPLEEFLTCVRSVLNGRRHICSEILEVLVDECLDQVIDGTTHACLTDSEYVVAKYLINGMKTSEIAKRLGRSESTVSYFKTNLFRKLSVKEVGHLKIAMAPVQTTTAEYVTTLS